MPAGIELGVGYVNIVPSVAGFSQKLRSAVDADAIGKQIGTDVGRGVKAGIASTPIDLPTAKLHASAREAGTGMGHQMGSGLTSALGKAAAAIGALLAGRRVFDFGQSVFESFSDLNESTTKAQQVFGDAFARVDAFAEQSARTIGSSRQQALEAGATFGNLFRAMGIGVDTAADMSLKLLQLSGDLASFNNVDPTEALEALRSGLVGETEPLRRFGININEDRIKTEAFRLGLVKANVDQTKAAARTLALEKSRKKAADALKKYGKDSNQYREAVVDVETAEAALAKELQGKVPDLNAAQKAQAAYSIMLQDTSIAQGDFARTSEGAANKQRILSAEWSNFKAALGEKVAPIGMTIIDTMMTGLTNLSNWWATNGPTVTGWFTRLRDGFLAVFGPDPVANFSAGVDIVKGKFNELFGPDSDVARTGQQVPGWLDAIFGEDKVTNFELGAMRVAGAVDTAATALDNLFGPDKRQSFVAGADQLRTKYDELATDFERGAIIVQQRVQPIWDAIGNSVLWLWDKVLSPFKDWIVNVWIPQGIQFLSTTVDNLKNIVTGTVDTLTTAFDVLLKTWEGIGKALTWVKEHVVDPIIGAIQTLIDKLDLIHSNPITSAVGRQLGLPGFAEGGIVPGPRNQPQLVVAHGGEMVIPANAVARGLPAGAGSVSVGSITVVGSPEPRATAFALRSELRWLSMVAGGT